MVEFTVEEILVAERALSNLAQAKLPISVGYQVGKTIKAVAKEIKEIRENQFKIAEKYGERGEDGELVERNGMYPIPPEKQAEFNAEMEELLSETCSLNVVPINVEKLGDEVELSVADLMALGRFLAE